MCSTLMVELNMDLVNVVFVMDLSGIVTHRVFKFYDYN